MFQFDQGESQFGSQYSSLNYIGAYYKDDNLRKISIVPLRELKALSEIESILKSSANAVLFIIPNPPYSSTFEALINQMQIYLSENAFFIPVYFSYENSDITKIISELESEYKIAQGEQKKTILDTLGFNKNYLHFSLSLKEPKKKEVLHLENFSGFLEVGSQNGAPNPIIAIVTYYDSFGVVSDLPSGVNSNGSGVIAMMELIRILSKFYENYESVIKYDILFVMTSAGNLNFEGTRNYLETLEPSISDNLQYVLCLDSIGEAKDLFLHLSRFPKDHEDIPNKLYSIFNTTSGNMNVNLTYIKKKIFLTNKYVPWEHEQFSKKKIISGTLSSIKDPIDSDFNRTVLTDITVDKEILQRNIKFVAESVLAFLFDYNISKFAIFKDDENFIDNKNIDSWISYFKKASRFPLNIEKGSSINNNIFNFLNTYLTKAKRQSFDYDELKFYENNSGDIKIYSVKSKMIDLYLLIAIFSYLIVLYIYTKGIKGFISGIRDAFSYEDN